MGIREEFLYDFSFHLPRILVSGRTAVIDNVKRLLLISETNIIVDNGARYTSVSGEELQVLQMDDQRLILTGAIRGVEFYGGEEDEKNRE